ncbi:hypothetical protein Tsubulata_010166 [Turnera subulata]|uniref:Uncharacterized protein n=1 Tax=Turnera subulata TaxID=218843 RepID=A0A9Q0JJT9_9ROSI|nr:hypothetical protein Tsubulata_010166 [Turnera subulata]
MEQRTSRSLLYAMSTPEELEVADILLELPELITRSEFLSQNSYSWGVKRKRSGGNLSAACQRPVVAESSSSPAFLDVGGTVPLVSPVCEPEKTAADKAEAGSPATPLAFSFSPSECDENPNKRPRKKVYGKKPSKEQLEKTLQESSNDREALLREKEQLLAYRDQQQAINSALKLRRIELGGGLNNNRQQQYHQIISHGGLSFGIKLKPAIHVKSVSSSMGHHDPAHQPYPNQAPFIMDPTAGRVTTGDKLYPYPNSQASTSSLLQQSITTGTGFLAMGGEDNMGPRGVPYFNPSVVKPEPVMAMAWVQQPPQQLDMVMMSKVKKEAQAQARQNRIQICRDKNSSKLRIRPPVSDT